MMRWYVSENGKTTGPFDEERLRMLVHWGKVSQKAFLCDSQWSAWIAIKQTTFARLLQEQPREWSPARLLMGLLASCVVVAGFLVAAA
jgi:hypothetical protein